MEGGLYPQGSIYCPRLDFKKTLIRADGNLWEMKIIGNKKIFEKVEEIFYSVVKVKLSEEV